MKNKKQLIVSITFLLLGIAYFIGTFFIKEYSGYGTQSVDSSFVPKILGVLMIGLSVFLLVQTLLENKRAEATTQVESTIPDDDEVVKTADNKSFIIILVMMIIYLALMESLGFIITTAAFMICSIFFLTPKEKRNIPLTLILSLVMAVGSYYLFVYSLGLMLPAGILPL